jgi:enoyl-CoA hydratase
MLRRDIRGATAWLTLDRPDKLNAFTGEMIDTWASSLAKAQADEQVNVIVVTGNGRAFCAGLDLKEFLAATVEDDPRRAKIVRTSFDRVRNCRIPVIAAVNGPALGAGTVFASVCDIRIAADTARFSHAEQRLGLAGNTWHLNTQILKYGPKRARELLLLGDEFDGPSAERFGLVNRSVAEADLEATVEQWAGRIARHARDALVTGRAMWQLAMDSLGGSEQFARGYVGHTLGTNLRFEPDEFNFLRERKRSGTTGAFSDRETHFSGD